MSIQLRCNNILEYDNQAGKYVRCQHQFWVDDELGGAKVPCPQCKQKVQAPHPKFESIDLEEDFQLEPEVPPPNTPSQPAPPDLDRDPVDDKPSQPALELITDEDWPDLEKLEEVDPLATTALNDWEPTTDVFSVPNTFCPKCGEPMEDPSKLCQGCGYHSTLSKPVKELIGKFDPPPETGFRLWMSDQLSEGESLEKVAVLGWVAASLVMLVVSILTIRVMGWWSALLILPIYFIVVALSGIIITRWAYKLDSSPTFTWTLSLAGARLFSWREFIWPFRLLKMIDLRGSPITDEDLGNLENLRSLEVLDLESTKISNESIPLLAGLSNLRCLVVRRTLINKSGIAKLLNKRPKLWVWY